MTATRDKFGRPIVVVTGMGVVTSLGAGKTDNWAKLTAGESGIRTITRFPLDGLKTTMAGTVDFIPVEPFSSTLLSEKLADLAVEEAVAEASIGSKGNFPGPLFLAVAPVEVEWYVREGMARETGATSGIDYDTMLTVSGGVAAIGGGVARIPRQPTRMLAWGWRIASSSVSSPRSISTST